MLLSTQLSRGAFALPLLAMFALLGATAVVRAPEQTAADLNLAALTAPRCEAPRALPTLRLAMAPADLGALGTHGPRACRG